MTPADTNVIQSLTEWDTPALSNALDALRLRPHNTGYSDGSGCDCSQARTCCACLSGGKTG